MAGAHQLDGLGLVRPQRAGQPLGDGRRERAGEVGVPSGSGGLRVQVDQPAGTQIDPVRRVVVMDPVALGRQIGEQVGDARPRESVEVERTRRVRANGHGEASSVRRRARR